MIADADIERAIHWLAETAPKAAQARAEREYLGQWIKVEKARLMRESGGGSVAEQEREALTHPDYAAALEAYRQAISTDERYRWLQTAAETKISAWQTMSRKGV